VDADAASRGLATERVMLLSVVIVSWNGKDDLRACLSSLRVQTHRELEIIVVDNGSTDGSPELVRAEFSEVTLLAEGENLGFAEGCNRGIAVTRGEWVAMLNCDAVADPRWAEALMKAASTVSARCGMLQSLLLFSARPDVVNAKGIVLTKDGGGHNRGEDTRHVPSQGVEEIFCPTAGAAAYRRTMLEAIALPSGYFDRDHFMYYEDMDLGWRARLAGWSACYVPDSIVLHRSHGSTVHHGRPWLVVHGAVNRLRTLLKNASWLLVAQTSPRTLREVASVVRHERLRGVRRVASAVQQSLEQRARVGALAQVPRASVEARWRGQG
jgi:GT2 family glycosyltransferase